MKQWITPPHLPRALLFEDGRRLVVGLAGVDDDGQAHLAGQAELPAEDLALDVARRVVVVEVEADLADGHDAAVLRPGRAARRTVFGGQELASCGWTPARPGRPSSSATRSARR